MRGLGWAYQFTNNIRTYIIVKVMKMRVTSQKETSLEKNIKPQFEQ